MGRKILAAFSAISVVLFLLGARGAMKTLATKGPGRLEALPAFEMTAVTANSQTTINPGALAGKPWIANFIFTRCSGPCPLLSMEMAKLQKELPEDVWLVSFTVDPDRDTPEVLRKYAGRFSADPKRWVFVTGEKGALYKLMYEGFKLSMVEDRNAPSGYRVTHSTKFVLVDAKGRVRGYYASDSDSDLKKLKQDAVRLLEEPWQNPSRS
ncbi:MAG: SCO family protein [Elusimicrobia bacterium]|nr:SCO family protein [Elusimicrobiota bacterium]